MKKLRKRLRNYKIKRINMGWIIPAAVGLVNSIVGSIQSRRNTRRTLAAQRGLMEYQYAQDKEMWNMQNQYNHPLAQKNRLMQAGLNPALMYGNAPQNVASEMPKYNGIRPEVDIKPVQLPEMLGIYNDLRLKNAQIDNVEQQTRLLSEKANSEMVSQQLTGVKRDLSSIDLMYKDEMSKYSVESKKKGVEIQEKKIANLIEDLILKKGDAKLKEQVLRNKKAEGYNTWLRNIYQKAINDLVQRGVMPTDNLIIRQLSEYFGGLKQGAKDWWYENFPVGK